MMDFLIASVVSLNFGLEFIRTFSFVSVEDDVCSVLSSDDTIVIIDTTKAVPKKIIPKAIKLPAQMPIIAPNIKPIAIMPQPFGYIFLVFVAWFKWRVWAFVLFMLLYAA